LKSWARFAEKGLSPSVPIHKENSCRLANSWKESFPGRFRLMTLPGSSAFIPCMSRACSDGLIDAALENICAAAELNMPIHNSQSWTNLSQKSRRKQASVTKPTSPEQFHKLTGPTSSQYRDTHRK